ncbi:MAG: FAD/NAD(P)-binding protein, partial [Flavobacterium sp.]|nr:FAD/NAD(P)-binding protein [Flavobacterium sp.]
MRAKRRIAIVGGGPSGLFLYKRLLETGETNFEVEIFEKKAILGSGMPYSTEGANDEHVTNISDNETPELVTSIGEWLQTVPQELLERFNIDIVNFNEYKVLPRLLFGYYLTAQFDLLRDIATKLGIET